MNGSWWVVVVGGWWLVVGGRWMVVDGWWLVDGNWWLMGGGWWLVVSVDACQGHMSPRPPVPNPGILYFGVVYGFK